MLSARLNLVERWFAELTNRRLRRSAHRGITELEADVRGSVKGLARAATPPGSRTVYSRRLRH
jgi:hypothetical protein